MPCPGLLHGTPGAVGAAPASCPTQHAAAQELRASMREQSRKGKAVSAHTPFRFTLLCPWAGMRRPSVNECWQKSTHGILQVGFVAKECSVEQCCGTAPAWEHSHLAVWAFLVTPRAAGKERCENRGLQGGHGCKMSEKRVTVPIAAAGLLSYHPWVDFASPALDVFTINSNQSH